MSITEPAPVALLNARWRTGARFERLHHGTLLLQDGRIRTVVPAEAGTAAVRLPPETQRLDLDGALVVPGFVDTHTHLGWAGEGLWRVDWSGVDDRATALARLRLAAERIEPGLWLLGGGWSGGWSRARLPDAELPGLAELDAATGEQPLFLTSADGSLAVCNSRALALFRLTPGLESALPPGGDVEVDAHGRLTGRLYGAAAHARATAGAIPPPDRYRRRAEVQAALRALGRHGITEAHDIATLPDPGPTPLTWRERSFTDGTLFDDLAASGDLTARVSLRPHLDRWQEAATAAAQRGHRGLVTVGGVKLLLDRAWYSPPGAGGGYTYRYPGFETALGWLRAADRAGLDVSIHAVGDLGVREALDLFAQAVPTPGRRHRLVHARRIAPEDLGRIAPLGMLAEMQPWDLVEELPALCRQFDEAFLATAYPFAALLRAGVRVAFGSDWRLDQRPDQRDLDPLWGLHAAVTRTPPDAPGAEPWQPAQRIDLAAALAAYTRAGAWAAGAEAERGAVEPGRQADLAVLSRDVLVDGPACLPATRVLLTIVAGRIVYTAPA